MSEWTELGAGVLYQRFDSWNLNVGLVIGTESALVVDTRVSPAQGRRLRRSIETVTRKRLVVVNTHAHLDHCLGNHAFRDVTLVAHRAATAVLACDGPRLLHELASSPDAPPRAELANAEVTLPTESVEHERALDLGHRAVRLVHHGRGHTAGDLVVEVPDARVAFGGDLIRGDGAPWYGDAFPLEWPGTLRTMLRAGGDTWVPGHGRPMTTVEVTAQARDLASIAGSIRFSWASGASTEEAGAALPLNAGNARHAVDRGFRSLRTGGVPCLT